MKEDEEQPDDLPYFVCRQPSGSEYIFTESELMDISLDQEGCLLKEAILKGSVPNMWSFDLYDKWL